MRFKMIAVIFASLFMFTACLQTNNQASINGVDGCVQGGPFGSCLRYKDEGK